MNDAETINQIIAFADKCHGEQMRRYQPDRYIVHPTRVMEICRQYTSELPQLAAAILHDVLEDTPVTMEELAEFLQTVMSEPAAAKTIQLVLELTDVYVKEDYPDWNRRKRKDKEAARLGKTSAAARTIKYADIIDNAPEITEKDPDFAQRLLPEYKALLRKMTKGNAALYERATTLINQCLKELRSKNPDSADGIS